MVQDINLMKSKKFLLSEGYEGQNLDEDFDLNEESEDLNEMAKITGDLQDIVDKLIQANPDMERNKLLSLIKKSPLTKSIIMKNDEKDLADNQLGRYIDLKRGDRDNGKRGRPGGSGAPEADLSPEAIEDEMTKLQAQLDALPKKN